MDVRLSYPSNEDKKLEVKGRYREWQLRHWFSSIGQRIVITNIIALLILVGGIFYLDQFKQGLIEAKVQSLLIQGEIIAGAISATATIEEDYKSVDIEKLIELRIGETTLPTEEKLEANEFLINPEQAAPTLRRLISPTRTRALLYDREGILLIDSLEVFTQGQIAIAPIATNNPKEEISIWDEIVYKTKSWFRTRSTNLSLYVELGPDQGKEYPEVVRALEGRSNYIERINDKGELIITVAVPIQRFRAVLGALVLSTIGGDIDEIVAAERWDIFRILLVAFIVVALLSLLLASTIAGPMRKLAAAAYNVRISDDNRREIPDFSYRRDEIGDLSTALRDMTRSLFERLDAIESFAADVAHELKNPLTSLRSAVETLPKAKDEKSKSRLLEVILDDVSRLDRLITDISSASRLDAELARQKPEPVDLSQLINTIATVANEIIENHNNIEVIIIKEGDEKTEFIASGNDFRLGQVVRNLIDNAISFSPKGAKVYVTLLKDKNWVGFRVEDDGPGIDNENLSKIFERFYTDRPEIEKFGKNSGLGLSISKQIVEASEGEIKVENKKLILRNGPNRQKIIKSKYEKSGAIFTVSLPIYKSKKR